LIDALNGRMAVFSGDDATAAELIRLGAQGNISVTANVVPKLMSELCAAALQGNQEVAEQINNKIANLNNILFCESNPIPVKWALHEMGKIGSGIRLPLTPLAEQYRTPLRDALKDVGII
jgi:4-hydroxy-tetrahydrodipicolinate synthase